MYNGGMSLMTSPSSPIMSSLSDIALVLGATQPNTVDVSALEEIYVLDDNGQAIRVPASLSLMGSRVNVQVDKSHENLVLETFSNLSWRYPGYISKLTAATA